MAVFKFEYRLFLQLLLSKSSPNYDFYRSSISTSFRRFLDTLFTLQIVTAGKEVFLWRYRVESSDIRTGESSYLCHICKQKYSENATPARKTVVQPNLMFIVVSR